MPVKRKNNLAPNPWRDFICAFQLPLHFGGVLSPLSQLLWTRVPEAFELEKFLGAHPAAVHAKTWQGMWRALYELLSAIETYERDALDPKASGSRAGEDLARVTRIWMEQVATHLETIKKIHNSYSPHSAEPKRLKLEIAKLVEPLWNPLSRCTGALKHSAAEILPIHYEASESGVVSGFYVAAFSGLLYIWAACDRTSESRRMVLQPRDSGFGMRYVLGGTACTGLDASNYSEGRL